jgi:hypothetical protein
MRRLRDLQGSGETNPKIHSSWLWSWRSQVDPKDLTRAPTIVHFFPLMSFFPLGFLM